MAELGGTVLDGGSESRTNGDAIPSNSGDFNTVTVPTGGSATFDNSHPGYRVLGEDLSTMAMKVVGGNSANTTVRTGKGSGLTADNSEVRFWVYPTGASTSSRWFYDSGGNTFNVLLTNGNVGIYMNRSGATAPYDTLSLHTIGSYTVDTLYQFRVILNFTGSTFTVSYRTAPLTDWTFLKKTGASDNNIPMVYAVSAPSSTSTFNHYGQQNNTTYWLDEVQFRNSPIIETVVMPRTPTVTRLGVQRAAVR